MEEQDKAEVKEMVETAIKEAMAFSTPKYGDTPTDAIQLVPKKYVDGEIAQIRVAKIGSLSSTGDGSAGAVFPSGWTSAKNSTGDYTITHNLGTTDYTVVATSLNDYTVMEILTQNSNNVNIRSFVTTTGALIDSGFNFILIQE